MAAHDDPNRLLDEMAQMGSAGRAEGEDESRFPRTYLPVAEHLRAMDPDVVLVVGPRGAGKTELFRAVVEKRLLGKVQGRVPGVRLPPDGRTTWLSGYSSQGTTFPSEPQFRTFLQDRPASDELFLDLWLAYLVRVLKDELASSDLEPLFAPQGGDIATVANAYREHMQKALLALDALDERLAREGRYVFIAYDELDTLSRNDAAITLRAVRGLVALWATHARRWRHLRAKVFLRTDLYERAATAGGADFAKLMANRAELFWSDKNLLMMLTRRLANAGGRPTKLLRKQAEARGWWRARLLPGPGKSRRRETARGPDGRRLYGCGHQEGVDLSLGARPHSRRPRPCTSATARATVRARGNAPKAEQLSSTMASPS